MSADRLLVTVNGPDRPGITAELTQILADSGVRLVDVEQVVVQHALTLSLLIELDTPRAPGDYVLKELLFAGKRLGVEVDFVPVTDENEASPAAGTELVVTLMSERVSAAHLNAVSRRLAELGANIERIQRLTDVPLAALEILCSIPAGPEGSGPARLKRSLLDLSINSGFDIAVQRNDVYRRSKRLVVMDMDSTLIRIEVIDELARVAGVGEEVAAITRRAMAGEMDYDESLRSRVLLLKGLDASHLQRIAENLPLTDGAHALIDVLKRLGFRTAVISGGFDIPAKALQAALGLDYAYSNVLETRDGKLTGQVVGAIVNAQAKADLLEQIARQERISLDQTVAIGDGANDLLMIQRAGLGIAFHAKPMLREAAHSALTGGLERVLYLLGLGARDLRALR